MVSGARQLDYRQIRDHFDGYYMANCGYDRARAAAALADGAADMVSFGQLFLANPDLVARFQQAAELNTPDPDTFYGGNEKATPTIRHWPEQISRLGLHGGGGIVMLSLRLIYRGVEVISPSHARPRNRRRVGSPRKMSVK